MGKPGPKATNIFQKLKLGNNSVKSMPKYETSPVKKDEKHKTQDIKASRGVTMGINLGGGRSIVGLDLSGHKKKSNKPNPYQKSLDKGKDKTSPAKKALKGDQDELPIELQNAIKASPGKKWKSDAQRKAAYASGYKGK